MDLISVMLLATSSQVMGLMSFISRLDVHVRNSIQNLHSLLTVVQHMQVERQKIKPQRNETMRGKIEKKSEITTTRRYRHVTTKLHSEWFNTLIPEEQYCLFHSHMHSLNKNLMQ